MIVAAKVLDHAKRRAPSRLPFAMRCSTCALPVDRAMCRCPWCTADLDAVVAEPAPRPHASMTDECNDCGAPVRPDWSACPWCGAGFAWTLRNATETIRAILEEAGAFVIAKRIRLAYSRKPHSYVMDGEDRDIHLVAARLREDARDLGAIEHARRWLRRDKFFALDHPLHIALHEAGHVFEHYLRKRRLIDLDEAAPLVGDLREEYENEIHHRVAASACRHQRSFVSAYATLHPSDDFAETFAVVSFLRADRETLRAWAKYADRGTAVVRALEWMAALIRRHGR